MPLDPGEVPMLLAGAVNLGLAGALLYMGFHRPWNRAFALLLTILGLFRVGFAMGAMAEDAAAAAYWSSVLVRLGFADEFALLYLVAVFPHRRPWLPRPPWGFVPFFAGMVALNIAFALQPSLWSGLPAPWGPFRAPLATFAAVLHVAFAVVPFLLVRQALRAAGERDPRPVVLLAVALTLVFAHTDARVLATVLLASPAPALSADAAVSVASMALRLALLAALAVWLARLGAERAELRPYLALLVLPAGTGLAVALLPAEVLVSVVPRLISGTWFAVGGILLAYALLRHIEVARGVPEPERAAERGWGAPVLAGGVFMTLFLLVNAVVLTVSDAPFVLSLGVLGGLGLGAAGAWAALPPSARPRFAGPPGSEDRRLGPYRAALSAELATGASGPSLAAKLHPLRAELGVSEQEHAAMAYALRAVAGAEGPPVSRGLEPGGLFLGRYRVVRPLGQGGGGATHLCRDELVGRDVVIKVIRSPLRTAAGLEEVLREARAIGALQHPNVLTLHDVQQVGDEVFVVMEHAAGGSLAARLAKGPCGRDEFLTLAEGTLRALEAVHAAGMVHRDVKPSNILLTAEGLPKLADFGIAHIRGFETTAGPGGDGAAAGTVRYMSPEQARGRKTTPQSDLFSAAATLYEAWTGQPFLEAGPGESPVELQMRAARGRAFDRPLEGPKGLRAWFARALDPAPERRFGSATEMRVALAEALTSRGRAAASARRR